MSGEESFLRRARLVQYRGIDSDGNAALGSVERLENTYSNSTGNLRKFRAAAGKIRYGVAGGTGTRATILFIGDSKTMGAGADGSSGNTAGAEPISKPAFFSTILTAQGLPNTRNATFGWRGLADFTALNAYDTRFVTDSNMFSSGTNPATLGGYAWRLGSTTIQQWSPTGNVDTVDVLTRQSTSNADGIMGVKVDAGAEILQIDCGAAGGDLIVKTTAALGSLGTHAFKYYRKSGNFAYVLGLRAYNAASGNGFEIINAGAYGSTSALHVGGTWTADKVIPFLNNLVLTIIQLGTNDPDNSVPVSTTIANVQTLVIAAKNAGSDVIIEFPTYGPDGQYGTNAQREQMRQGYINLGNLYGCVVVDHATRFISWADANGLGLTGASVHETAAGYADEALFLSRVLLS